MAVEIFQKVMEESMKGWVKNLGIVFLISSTASSVNAQSTSIVEYPLAGKRLAAPVIIENNDDSTVEAQIPASADHHSARKAPHVVEFGLTPQPVSLQPPMIRPTVVSPHIQEFNTMTVEAFEPSMMTEPVSRASVKAPTVHKISKSAQSSTPGHKTVHVSMHSASTKLIPVEKLAIFPLNERPHMIPISRIVVPESNTLLSGKNRPSL
jgi:hypothetical protein